MIKLSIIIPYYDTYNYTIKLLRELQIQVTDEVEVILVDDGCNETRFDEFKEFKIIHVDHIGASAAWNLGIKAATGKFIGFIDSDDMIMMNYIEELIHAIDMDIADEILFDWFDINRNEVIKHPGARAIWKAIYRKEIVPLFNEEYVHHTDAPFQENLRRIKHTRRSIHKCLYCYRSRREGSITWRYRHGELRNSWEQPKNSEVT